MSRLIDADALLYDLEIVPLMGDGGVDINDLEEIIKRQPTVDPIKHGQWGAKSLYLGSDAKVFVCEACNKPVWWVSDYCPNCGAKMDEDEWEEPEINPCRGCCDYDGRGGCKSNGGCGAKMDEVEDETD